MIVTEPAGYELRLEPGGLDLRRFERLVAEARAAEPPAAAESLREALALWRGPPLADFAYESLAQSRDRPARGAPARGAQERIDAELALGRHAELVGELEALVAAHPLRERLRGQLMLALYRSGRQADALDAYRAARDDARRGARDRTGRELRRLEQAILDQDPELDAPSAPPGAPSGRPAGLPIDVVRRPQARAARDPCPARPGRTSRLLTLTGAGGTGKTRLAVEAAAGLGDEFPDGVVLRRARPVSDPELVAAAIAEALGVWRAPEAVSPRLDRHLRGRRALLVLDNFEHVLAAAPLSPSCCGRAGRDAPRHQPRAARHPGGAGSTRCPRSSFPTLVRPRQVGGSRDGRGRAAVRRARAARRAEFELTEPNAAAVAELCAGSTGLPLALELAAARIKLLSPAAILERLDRRLELLKAGRGADMPARHRTLARRDRVELRAPDAEEQALFTSLAVFVGGFTLEARRGGRGADGRPRRRRRLESLADQQPAPGRPTAGDEPRFGMLETIREYALERLVERGDGEAVRRRHAELLSSHSRSRPSQELLGPRQLRWLERLDAERDNIRAALTWAVESGEAEIGLRIAAALWRFWQFARLDRGGPRAPRTAAGDGHRLAGARGLSAQARAASLATSRVTTRQSVASVEASLPVHRRTWETIRKLAGSLGLLG